MNKVTARAIAVLILLTGCASEPARLNHYLLHSTSEAEAEAAKPGEHYINMGQVILPDYLKQRGLAYQTSATQVQLSSQHLWAEPLQSGVVQVLERGLWKQAAITVVPASARAGEPVASLSIQVDNFIASYRGDVIFSGKYWLETESGSPLVRRFAYTLALERDGYDHTVEKMREALHLLARDVAAQVVKE